MAIRTAATTIGAITTIAEGIERANVGLHITVGSRKNVAANGSANIGAEAMTGAIAGTTIEAVGMTAATIKFRSPAKVRPVSNGQAFSYRTGNRLSADPRPSRAIPHNPIQGTPRFLPRPTAWSRPAGRRAGFRVWVATGHRYGAAGGMTACQSEAVGIERFGNPIW